VSEAAAAAFYRGLQLPWPWTQARKPSPTLVPYKRRQVCLLVVSRTKCGRCGFNTDCQCFIAQSMGGWAHGPAERERAGQGTASQAKRLGQPAA